MNKNKENSPLVQSVINLDTQFSNLDRLSAQIVEMELKSEFDFKQARLLMTRFAESAELVTSEIQMLAQQLAEARERAEAAAKLVADKSLELQDRNETENEKNQSFLALTKKVHDLNEELKSLKKPEGEDHTDEERESLRVRLAELQNQLQPLIEEAKVIKKEAQASKMKVLEQNSESLSQTLSAVSEKLALYIQPTAH